MHDIRQKKPFDPAAVMRLLHEAVEGLPPPSMFQLRDLGYSSPFQQAVACLISVRTYEEVSLPAARRLFVRASTAEAVADLTVEEIDRLISPATFHERKAAQIQEIARLTASRFGGELPCEESILMVLPGVGVKCTALALGIACEQHRLPVDIHVHRVANRWGIVQTQSPEKTQIALEAIFPPERWLELNERLVPFGKAICTRLRPRCSTCLLLDYCQQIGVEDPR